MKNTKQPNHLSPTLSKGKGVAMSVLLTALFLLPFRAQWRRIIILWMMIAIGGLAGKQMGYAQYAAKPDSLHKTDTLLKVKELGFGFTSLFSTSYSLQYRWGTDKILFRVNANIRGNTSFGSGSSNSTYVQDTITSGNANTTKTSTPINFSSSIGFSALHVIYITKKFGIMHGGGVGLTYLVTTTKTTETGTNINSWNPTYSYPYSNTTTNHSQTLQPYISLIFGAVYKINKSFLIYAEIAPNFYYAHTNSTINTIKNNYGYNSNQQNYSSTNNTSTINNTFGLANLSNLNVLLTLVYRITKKL
ncbi:MAG: hypothetical protein ACYDCN_09920 [Bacteroidia bacterium]